jgi:VWFA-related protein
VNRSVLPLAATLLWTCSLVAQSPAPQQAEATQSKPPDIRLRTEEVNLDMVFHDKKGRTVHDLRPEEIHVFEDGVEQHLASFRYFETAHADTANPSAAPAASAGSIPLDPMRELRFVTLVFQGLDQDGKRFFRQALEDMLNQAPEQDLYFSVVVIDQKLNMIQPFTNDHAALLKAVNKSMMWDTPQYMRSSDEIKTELRHSLSQGESDSQSDVTGDLATPPTVSASGRSGPSAGQVQGGVAWRMAKMQYDMLEQADAQDRDVGARGTIDGLLALVKAESELPGRKVVLYFNPYLFIPEILKEQYNYMIGTANRSNVTFYTVDPKGLVTWSQEGGGRSQLSSATGEIFHQQITGAVGDVSTTQARVDETADNGMRSNPLLWLRDLAQQTGGVSIAETNDLKAPLRTAMEDVRSYYEATYAPHDTAFDGKFRKISVKVDRPGIEVHTRSGYFALPQLTGGQQLVAYEVPLLNALNAAAPAADVAFSASAQRFSERGPKIEYMLTLEAPLKGLTFAPQPDGKSAIVDAPLLAVIKNSSGEVVAKFSKDFAVQVPQNAIDGYKDGNLVQTYRTQLAPGAYSLEAAIMDRKGNKIGVKKTSFTVPDTNGKLAISDVVIVRRTEELKNNQIVDPFYYPGGKVIPTLNTTLKGGAGNILPFYFAVYPDPAIKDAPKLTMGFYKGGQYLGSASAPLPAVQQDGRIPYIASLPADKFTPGSYEIRIGIAQGSASVEQKVDFQVQ